MPIGLHKKCSCKPVPKFVLQTIISFKELWILELLKNELTETPFFLCFSFLKKKRTMWLSNKTRTISFEKPFNLEKPYNSQFGQIGLLLDVYPFLLRQPHGAEAAQHHHVQNQNSEHDFFGFENANLLGVVMLVVERELSRPFRSCFSPNATRANQ